MRWDGTGWDGMEWFDGGEKWTRGLVVMPMEMGMAMQCVMRYPVKKP